MIVLGVSNSKDSGACLLIDGVLVAAVNEERFTRTKLTRDFPEQSIDWLLREHSLTHGRVDAVGLGTWKGIDSWSGLPKYVASATERVAADASVRTSILSRLNGSIESDSKQAAELESGLIRAGLANLPRYQCYHHHAHALAAAEYSPFTNALVVTLDGRGDFMSGSVSSWQRNGEMSLLRTELELDSLGAFYGWVTYYLGFTPDRHEGKVTGLAARGDSSVSAPIFRSAIRAIDGRLEGRIGDCYAPFMRADLPVLRSKLADLCREDIAAGAQTVLEEVVTEYISHYIATTGIRQLCLAGGIFANVLLNYRLQCLPGIERIFVFPHMGDGGIAAGGAAYACKQLGGTVKPLQTAYLGPRYTELECLDAIAESDLIAEAPADLAGEVAAALEAGKVVGIFQGRMEYGPRALGNRSILASATNASINDELNNRLARSEFMPFAPVTLFEHARECYEGWDAEVIATKYMTTCYLCTDRMRVATPAVVHVDGTARPQVIANDDNPFYYAVLRAYYERTGIPTLVNTSFNEHEAPIVCTPAQALEVLQYDGVDLLAMPPFLVRCPQKVFNDGSAHSQKSRK